MSLTLSSIDMAASSAAARWSGVFDVSIQASHEPAARIEPDEPAAKAAATARTRTMRRRMTYSFPLLARYGDPAAGSNRAVTPAACGLTFVVQLAAPPAETDDAWL